MDEDTQQRVRNYEEWTTALERSLAKSFIGPEDLPSLRREVACFVAMQTIEGQVFNGGFCAIYYNNCWEYLPYALEGYANIGATGNIAILRVVMESVPKVFSEQPREKWPEEYPMPDLSEGGLDVLEQAWYRLEREVDELKAKYVRANPELFVPLKGL
jgi:hypothetical protein